MRMVGIRTHHLSINSGNTLARVRQLLAVVDISMEDMLPLRLSIRGIKDLLLLMGLALRLPRKEQAHSRNSTVVLAHLKAGLLRQRLDTPVETRLDLVIREEVAVD